MRDTADPPRLGDLRKCREPLTLGNVAQIFNLCNKISEVIKVAKVLTH